MQEDEERDQRKADEETIAVKYQRKGSRNGSMLTSFPLRNVGIKIMIARNGDLFL